jgi:hypothetical protein
MLITVSAAVPCEPAVVMVMVPSGTANSYHTLFGRATAIVRQGCTGSSAPSTVAPEMSVEWEVFHVMPSGVMKLSFSGASRGATSAGTLACAAAGSASTV